MIIWNFKSSKFWFKFKILWPLVLWNVIKKPGYHEMIGCLESLYSSYDCLKRFKMMETELKFLQLHALFWNLNSVFFFCCLFQGWDWTFAWRIESVFAEFPGVIMRHESIEMVCAHVLQSREPPPHNWGLLGASAIPNS